MSFNSSSNSSSNSSFNSSSNSSIHPSIGCFESRPGVFIFLAFSVTNIFFLPLFILVLCVGCQRWRQRRSGSAAGTTSHSDVFTFNMTGLELISVLGSCFYSCGTLANVQAVTLVGVHLLSITSPGQTLFHLLTCVDRYLAVVHPITYLGLRRAGGVRIRNISIGCVWLFCFGSPALMLVFGEKFFVGYAGCSLLGFSLVVVCFCSISVLCVLIRPRQREVGGKREQADQTKHRAFCTMLAIMAALLLRSAGVLYSSAIFALLLTEDRCVVGVALLWATVPGSLVLPLLFLHKAGKLPSCKHDTAPG